MTDAAVISAPMPTGKSRVTNGSKVLANVDGRTRAGRMYRDILDALVIEFDAADESDMQLCRLAASYSVALQESAARQARGEPVSLAEMTTTGNLLRRLLQDLSRSRRDRRRAQRSSGATA